MSPPHSDGSDLTREMEILYDAHAEFLLKFAVATTADLEFSREAVQESFLQYAELRQRENTPESPRIWLLQAVRTLIRGRRAESEKLNRRIPDIAPTPESLVLAKEARKLVERLAAPRELECFLLRSEGFSYSQIAKVMGISTGTVGATLARAIRKVEFAVYHPEAVER